MSLGGCGEIGFNLSDPQAASLIKGCTKIEIGYMQFIAGNEISEAWSYIYDAGDDFAILSTSTPEGSVVEGLRDRFFALDFEGNTHSYRDKNTGLLIDIPNSKLTDEFKQGLISLHSDCERQVREFQASNKNF